MFSTLFIGRNEVYRERPVQTHVIIEVQAPARAGTVRLGAAALFALFAFCVHFGPEHDRIESARGFGDEGFMLIPAI